jgi:hypothetical protein
VLCWILQLGVPQPPAVSFLCVGAAKDPAAATVAAAITAIVATNAISFLIFPLLSFLASVCPVMQRRTYARRWARASAGVPRLRWRDT